MKYCSTVVKKRQAVSGTILSVLAVHRPYYISICISTLPTHHTTSISNNIRYLLSFIPS